jgi:hypothetical protein
MCCVRIVVPTAERECSTQAEAMPLGSRGAAVVTLLMMLALPRPPMA